MVIIYQGKRYEACIEDPERLIPVLENLSEYDVPEIEELSLYFGFTVYAEKTGDEDDTYFTLYHVLSNEEFDDVDFEFDWNEDDEEGLKRCFLSYGRCTEKNRLSGRLIIREKVPCFFSNKALLILYLNYHLSTLPPLHKSL